MTSDRLSRNTHTRNIVSRPHSTSRSSCAISLIMRLSLIMCLSLSYSRESRSFFLSLRRSDQHPRTFIYLSFACQSAIPSASIKTRPIQSTRRISRNLSYHFCVSVHYIIRSGQEKRSLSSEQSVCCEWAVQSKRFFEVNSTYSTTIACMMSL